MSQMNFDIFNQDEYLDEHFVLEDGKQARASFL